MSQRDDQLNRLAPYIDMIIGMPITVTQNINTSHGICNGTFGTVIDIQFPEGTLFSKIHDAESYTFVLIPTKPPDAIIIFIENGIECPFLKGIIIFLIIYLSYKIYLNLDYPIGSYPILRYTSKSDKKILLGYGRDDLPREVSVKLCQFPIVSSVACTMYKIQGETVDSLVVANWKAKYNSCPQQAYICVSRVTKGDDFCSMDLFTEKHKQSFKPPIHTHIEDKRLRILSASFLNSFNIKEMFDQHIDMSHKQSVFDKQIDNILANTSSESINKNLKSSTMNQRFSKLSSMLATKQSNMKLEVTNNISEIDILFDKTPSSISETTTMNQRFSKLSSMLAKKQSIMKHNTTNNISDIDILFDKTPSSISETTTMNQRFSKLSSMLAKKQSIMKHNTTNNISDIDILFDNNPSICISETTAMNQRFSKLCSIVATELAASKTKHKVFIR
jgi:predicted nucleotidyltransferase